MPLYSSRSVVFSSPWNFVKLYSSAPNHNALLRSALENGTVIVASTSLLYLTGIILYSHLHEGLLIRCFFFLFFLLRFSYCWPSPEGSSFEPHCLSSSINVAVSELVVYGSYIRFWSLYTARNYTKRSLLVPYSQWILELVIMSTIRFQRYYR